MNQSYDFGGEGGDPSACPESSAFRPLRPADTRMPSDDDPSKGVHTFSQDIVRDMTDVTEIAMWLVGNDVDSLFRANKGRALPFAMLRRWESEYDRAWRRVRRGRTPLRPRPMERGFDPVWNRRMAPVVRRELAAANGGAAVCRESLRLVRRLMRSVDYRGLTPARWEEWRRDHMPRERSSMRRS